MSHLDRTPLWHAAVLAAAALGGSCTTTETVRISGRDPMGADYVFLVVDENTSNLPVMLTDGMKTREINEYLLPVRIENFLLYAQFTRESGQWQPISRRVRGKCELDSSSDPAWIELEPGFLLEDRPKARVGIFWEQGGRWGSKVLDADDFLDSHELSFELVNGALNQR